MHQRIRESIALIQIILFAACSVHKSERDVVSVMQKYAIAYGSNDADTLEKMRATNFVFTSSRGLKVTNAEELNDIRSGKARAESASLADISVQIHEKTAVLTCVADLRGTWRGQRYDGKYALTAIWILTDKSWTLVAEQASRIPE